MKNKILAFALTLALICALVLPVLPVSAGAQDDVPTAPTEKLEKGWHRLNPHTKAHTISTEVIDGQKFATVEAIIDSLPTTLDDNRTLIDTNWYLITDRSGQSYFQNGANFFTVRVMGGRVSVEDRDGRLSVWNPILNVGGDVFTGGTPVIADDPINENYKGNCLKWTYGTYGGWWIFGGSAKVERYLRVIEGFITELWILPEDPKANVSIRLNEMAEGNYGADITWVNAYDAENMPLKATKNQYGNYVINATEFKDKTYPVTIDPTEDFITSSYDGYTQYLSWNSYNEARTATTASSVTTTNAIARLGQYYGWSPSYPYWVVFRAHLMFDTSPLPDGVSILSSKLYLYGDRTPNVDYYIVVQSGMPTYPHMPVIASDYNYAYYSGNGGQFWTGGFSTSSYNILTLNSTGISWINDTGWTKFTLRSSRDIDGTIPWEYNHTDFKAYEYGAGYRPYLKVTYSEPIVLPTVSTLTQTSVTETSATGQGYLDDDGNEPCSVRFGYALWGGAYSYTAWESGYTTGDYFNKTIYGLSPGKTYCLKAQASNSAGTDDSGFKAFMTYPYVPYNFAATGEEDQIALTWTKGSGAQNTVIRRAEGTYPTTPTSGTAIYNDTGTSHDDTTTVNGTTYYYSAWSYSIEYGYDAYSQTKATDYGVSYELSNPSVTTNAATDVETTTATLNLYLDSLGGYGTTNVWFQYYKGAGSWTDNETTPTQKTAPGSHTAGVVSLTTDTLYHMRAAAINSHGTTYGDDVPFTTDAPSAPTMTTNTATGVQLTSVTLNGTVTDDGDATVTAWFEYGLTTSYGDSSPTTSGLTTDDTFYYNLGNLLPATTYHYRAVGENSVGIGYGADQEFETATPDAPALNTNDATDVGSNSAVLRGTLTSDGGVACEVRFQYGTSEAYGTDTGWQPGFTTGVSFSQFISDLTVGETYHFRAQAKNAGGTTNGSDKTFTTKFSPPTRFTTKAISSTTVSIEWEKQGDQTYIRYKQTGFPIDRDDGLPVYFGPDEEASVSGLTAGTTYYFRAWSWREGDVWAEGYAEDVATTQPTAAGMDEERPESVTVPEEPSGWFQTPSGARLTKLPFYSAFVGLAEAYEVPEGIMWLTIGLVLTLIVGALVFMAAHNALASTIAGGGVIVACAALGMMPLWFIAIYAVFGGGFTYAARNV